MAEATCRARHRPSARCNPELMRRDKGRVDVAAGTGVKGLNCLFHIHRGESNSHYSYEKVIDSINYYGNANSAQSVMPLRT